VVGRYLGTVALRGAQAFAWLWVSLTILLFLWLLMSSFKSNTSVLSSPWSLPDGFYVVQNYVTAWEALNFGRAAINTVGVVGLSALAIVMLAAPAAYVLSRTAFRGARSVTALFVIGVGVPVQVLLIPLVLLLARMGFSNSLLGVGIAYVSVQLPFTVFLLTGYFKSLPYELEEAAALDGAGPVRTFFSVMLPLARPGLITAIILNSVVLWNEFLLALTILTDNSKYTLSLELLSMYGGMRYTANWAALFAGSVIVILPMVVFYLWLSNRIIEGMTLGSGK
jgi:N-acetylglucosamine transport system permease protein